MRCFRLGLPAAALMLALSAAPRPAHAAFGAVADPGDFTWQTHPGAQVPPNAAVRDEAGHAARLRDYFGKTPVILDIGYYRCPTLCGVARADLLAALKASGLREGSDYTLVAMSIDPAETPEDASRAKEGDLSQAPFANGSGWHYTVGEPGAIEAVTSSVGFRYRYNAEYKQFLHPTGLVVLTNTGLVSGYLLGVGYHGGDLRAAVLRAGAGNIVAQAALPAVLLLCFHFDETTGRYTLAIMKVLRLMGVVTILTIAGLFIVLHRKRTRIDAGNP
jgi:protein SCO1/2